jgi:hypothetical protein
MDECQAYISNQKIMPKKLDRFDPNGSKGSLPIFSAIYQKIKIKSGI